MSKFFVTSSMADGKTIGGVIDANTAYEAKHKAEQIMGRHGTVKTVYPTKSATTFEQSFTRH